MRKSRKKRASGIYKVEPLFRGDKGTLMVGDTTYYIEGGLSKHLVVSIPETTTRSSALTLERQLTKLAGKPVLVVTHNMAFLRATLLTGKEVANIVKTEESSHGLVS